MDEGKHICWEQIFMAKMTSKAVITPRCEMPRPGRNDVHPRASDSSTAHHTRR